MSERAKHQCHRDGCDSEATMGVKVHVLCRAPGVLPVPLAFDSTIKVCARHAVEGDVRKYLMNDKNREAMITGIMEGGFPEPDLLSLRVVFEPLNVGRAPLEIAAPICCDRAGCSKAAKWQIKRRFRMLWQRGKGKPLVEALTNMVVCDEHKALTRPQDFNDKAGESATRAWLAAKGVSMPDLKTAEVAFEPLDGGKRLQPKLWVGEDGPLDQFRRADGA